MHTSNNNRADDINLLKIVRYLCTTKIRHPMTIEQIKAWLKQFSKGPERTLALLILRHLIYRTSSQFESSLKQALKAAAAYFIPENVDREGTDWRDVLNGKVAGLDFYYGPPKNEFTRPGKSGEIISRLLKSCVPGTKFELTYPEIITNLGQTERFLLVDDGTFTGDQLIQFIGSDRGRFLANKNKQSGIVVGLAHEHAIDQLRKAYPNVPIFYGEKITSQECFVAVAETWIKDDVWPYTDISPLDQYLAVVNRAEFAQKQPLGYGNLGCMIAYEHGVPDDSLQLLWDESENWKPLFGR